MTPMMMRLFAAALALCALSIQMKAHAASAHPFPARHPAALARP